jgi:hypothetical protein
MVHTDDIGAQSLHESGIQGALLSVSEWIVCVYGVRQNAGESEYKWAIRTDLV